MFSSGGAVPALLLDPDVPAAAPEEAVLLAAGASGLEPVVPLEPRPKSFETGFTISDGSR